MQCEWQRSRRGPTCAGLALAVRTRRPRGEGLVFDDGLSAKVRDQHGRNVRQQRVSLRSEQRLVMPNESTIHRWRQEHERAITCQGGCARSYQCDVDPCRARGRQGSRTSWGRGSLRAGAPLTSAIAIPRRPHHKVATTCREPPRAKRPDRGPLSNVTSPYERYPRPHRVAVQRALITAAHRSGRLDVPNAAWMTWPAYQSVLG